MEKLKILNLFSLEKLFFLPDAIIDIKEFKEKVKNQVDFKLPFDNEKKIILAVGRLTKQKNFIYLVNEFGKFCLENDDYILVILGDGEEKKKIIHEIDRLKLRGKVYLLGHVNNVYKYMKISDIFILSSIWEEVGFVIVEAALSNLFVISSNCPNGPKEFLDYGNNGNLYMSDKKDALFESLNKFISDKEVNSKKISAKKSCLKYTRLRHFKKFENIIETR